MCVVKLKKYLIVLLLVFSILTLAGCSKDKSPKEVFDGYINSWQSSDFSGMYKLLSTDTKQNVDEKYFTERYQNVYKNAKVSKVNVQASYPEKFAEDKEGKVKFPVKIALETSIGTKEYDYEVTLIKEKQGKANSYHVIWDEKMILPELSKGDNVAFSKKLGVRGEIKDINGNPLAVNKKAIDIYVVPEKIKQDRDNTIAQLSKILGCSVDEIELALNQPYVKEHPDQRALITRVSREYDRNKALEAIKLTGVFTSTAAEETTFRYYPAREAAAHLIGYVDNITAEELEKYKGQGYDGTDIIGKTGLESIYEKRLRGEVGGSIYITDEKGAKKSTVLEKAAKDGENIKLTIDVNMQKDMYAQIKNDTSAAVGVDPKTGEVRALVSSPSYDPNVLSNEISTNNYLALEKDPRHPLLSRFKSAIVPGSTFKPITAAIGLKTGKLDASKKVGIEGESWQKDSSWGDYKVTRVHSEYASLDLRDALVYSDNIYFARAALDIDKDNFIKGTSEFGIGEKIPFAFPMDTSQIGDFKSDNDGIKLADSGYGQGDILMNPLQLAMIYGSFVNEGTVLSPILDTKDITDTPKAWKENVISKEIADTIVKDLVQVIEDPKGTGHDAQISGLKLAGKTGTAELKQAQGETGKENGWFVAFNTDNPKLVTLMVVEDVQSGKGSKYVVPKVKNIMEKYAR